MGVLNLAYGNVTQPPNLAFEDNFVVSEVDNSRFDKVSRCQMTAEGSAATTIEYDIYGEERNVILSYIYRLGIYIAIRLGSTVEVSDSVDRIIIDTSIDENSPLASPRSYTELYPLKPSTRIHLMLLRSLHPTEKLQDAFDHDPRVLGKSVADEKQKTLPRWERRDLN